MLGLAIHTTSPELGLAISNFGDEYRHQVWPLGRDLSSQLHVYLANFIQPQTWRDLSFIAVATGPGGFTGTRIGVVTARTLAQQLEIPLFAVSTLAALAAGARSHLTPSAAGRLPDIAVQMPAQRGELFGALYQLTHQSGLTPLFAETALTQASWLEKLNNWPADYHLIKAEGSLAASVNLVLTLAYSRWRQGQRPHWSEALPFYGQHPVVLSAEKP